MTETTVPITRLRFELRAAVAAWKVAGARVAVVPTMGALHAGHLALVEAAKADADRVIVTLFVNPRQFNNAADLAAYPRTEAEDAEKLAPLAVDMLYVPDAEQIYPPGFATTVSVAGVSDGLCGAFRPGHFDGVATVVTKLLTQTAADRAYFGEKDFQQIAVIREMVRQLRIPVEIIPCPIVRGEDGLALSSRNTLLDTDHRTAAPYIYKVLKAAVEKSHQTTPDQLAAWVTAQVESNPLLKVIYFQVVDAATMQQVRTWEESPAIQGCIAVQAGDIRLIDNIKLR